MELRELILWHIACAIQVNADYFLTTDAQYLGFDYTKWRQEMFDDLTIEEISHKAMSLRIKSIES